MSLEPPYSRSAHAHRGVGNKDAGDGGTAQVVVTTYTVYRVVWDGFASIQALPRGVRNSSNDNLSVQPSVLAKWMGTGEETEDDNDGSGGENEALASGTNARVR